MPPVPMSDTLQILEKVNAYYSTSFGALMTWTIALIGVIGVVVPIVFQVFQYFSFKRASEDTKRKIIAEATKGIEERYQKIEKESQKALAGVFALQAESSLKGKDFATSVESASNACWYWLNADDLRNLSLTIDVLLKGLPRLKKDDFTRDHDLEPSIRGLIELMKEKNENGAYTDRIAQIEGLMANKLPVAVKPPAPAH